MSDGDSQTVDTAVFMPGVLALLRGDTGPAEVALGDMTPEERDELWKTQQRLAADEAASALVRELAKATLRAIDRIEGLTRADILDEQLLDTLKRREGNEQDKPERG